MIASFDSNSCRAALLLSFLVLSASNHTLITWHIYLGFSTHLEITLAFVFVFTYLCKHIGILVYDYIQVLRYLSSSVELWLASTCTFLLNIIINNNLCNYEWIKYLRPQIFVDALAYRHMYINVRCTAFVDRWVMLVNFDMSKNNLLHAKHLTFNLTTAFIYMYILVYNVNACVIATWFALQILFLKFIIFKRINIYSKVS